MTFIKMWSLALNSKEYSLQVAPLREHSHGWKEPKKIVFIQCVGSRDKIVAMNIVPESAVCIRPSRLISSRIDSLMHGSPSATLISGLLGKVVNNSMSRYRKRESFTERNPFWDYQRSGKLIIKAEDELLGEPYEEEADLIVLATVSPSGKMPRASEAFWNSLRDQTVLFRGSPKMRPLDTATDEFFWLEPAKGLKTSPYHRTSPRTASRATIPLFAGRVRIEPITLVWMLPTAQGVVFVSKSVNSSPEDGPYRKVMTVNEAFVKDAEPVMLPVLQGRLVWDISRQSRSSPRYEKSVSYELWNFEMLIGNCPFCIESLNEKGSYPNLYWRRER